MQFQFCILAFLAVLLFVLAAPLPPANTTSLASAHTEVAHRGGKPTTATQALENTQTPCWAVNGHIPDECHDDASGKVYVTVKAQKNGEQMEQAKKDSARFNTLMHGAIKGTEEYKKEAGEA